MLVTLLPIMTEVRLVHTENRHSMVVTLLGMVIDFSAEQLLKAKLPMLLTLLGRVMEVRPLQPWNAPFPILFILFGIVMETILEQN